MRPWILGTRGSKLARAQSQRVADQLAAATGRAVELRILSTRGDRITDRPLSQVGGKGLFTAELEAGLRDGSLDFAVHSLKDLPTDDPDGLVLGALPERADPRDVLVGSTLAALPQGAVLGTGSARRRVQLRHQRPDLDVRGIRGNVDTRIGKQRSGEYAAVVLAAAGLHRVGLADAITEAIDVAHCVPASGQGCLGVQCRADDTAMLEALATIHHPPTAAAVTAERVFLAAVEGGCSIPASCHAWFVGEVLHARAFYANADDTDPRWADDTDTDPVALGQRLAGALR